MAENGHAPITELASEKYDPKKVDLVHKTVAVGADNATLYRLLELAARYDLDPLAGQIWAVPQGGRDGQAKRWSIMTGRDGFLQIANRQPDFVGMEGDVVHENDEFKRSRMSVTHSYSSKDRGKIIGAWAQVHRKDRAPIYFFAHWDEYAPGNANSYSPWSKQKSAMILKCAESTALRKAYSISGLVGEEEISGGPGPGQERAESEIQWGEDPSLAEWLPRLVEAYRGLGKHLPDAKLRLELNGASDEQRRAFAKGLEEALRGADAEVPEPIEQPTVKMPAVPG